MPRTSRSVSHRLATAANRKSKRRGEGRATILPPQVESAPVELAPGLGAPAPLDLPQPQTAPPPPRPNRLSTRPTTRYETRQTARRPTAAPITDYSYVAGDLRRIGMVAGVLILVLVALTLVPGLH
jgi:hypothetical protein